MRKVILKDNKFYGAYYSSNTPCIIWGAVQVHCYDCGEFDENGEHLYLNFVRCSKKDLEPYIEIQEDGTVIMKSESFDMSLSDADAVAESPLYQMVAAGQEIELSEGVMTQFDPAAAQLIAMDHQQGYSAEEIFERRAGLVVVQFRGMTFEDVRANHPDIYVEETVVDEEGNETIKPNIWACIPQELA